MNIRIGSTYEVIKGNVMWYESDKEFIGKSCVARSVFVSDYGVEIAAVEFSDGCCLALRTELLQVVRTPEQIARDAEFSALKEMREIFEAGASGSMFSIESGLIALRSAGYHKFEIVEGE